jgi:hypothetical protein
MACYWKMRKDFLDYLEDFMAKDSLIGSKISTSSKKAVSCASKISLPSVISKYTQTSKASEKSNVHDGIQSWYQLEGYSFLRSKELAVK